MYAHLKSSSENDRQTIGARSCRHARTYARTAPDSRTSDYDDHSGLPQSIRLRSMTISVVEEQKSDVVGCTGPCPFGRNVGSRLIVWPGSCRLQYLSRRSGRFTEPSHQDPTRVGPAG